ncbi:cupredoxin domain-containing protein [Pelagibius sp. Alg239-R121]|uniref:cupredoxin domain-containing protein n=1 Tax=Pelagibius sp. Alg239-R121 TaxID=2993448 RepID=UPI0024A77A01|nr:cupredoxin domain-containing protein [Pelagibius sp. Alg239-R121]
MNFKFVNETLTAAMVVVSIPLFATEVFAAGSHSSSADLGSPGIASDATRTIEVTMYDNYYEPESLDVQEGETVRFVIKNEGDLVHEFNIGTTEGHAAHQDEMMMMVEHGVLEADRINWTVARKMQASMGHGTHDDPNSTLLEPGESGEVIWSFPVHATLEFACNVPGHYDAGMMGEINLTH